MTDRRRLLITALVLAGSIVACDSTGPSAAASAPAATASVAPRSFAPTGPVTSPDVEPAMTIGPVDTGPPGTPPCELADLKASNGFVDEDADARLTEVVLVSAETCSVAAYPAFGIRDATEVLLLRAEPLGAGWTDLVPGVAYTSQLRFENWCGPEPDLPLTLALFIEAGEVGVTGSAFPGDGGMPACGAGADPVLQASAWEPTP